MLNLSKKTCRMGLDFIHLEMNGGREISEWSRVECDFAIITARIPICLLINVSNSQHGLKMMSLDKESCYCIRINDC